MRHSSTCVDNTIIYLRIQYLRRCALGTPWIFVILAIWTSTWIIFLSHTSPNKRGFQSYNKRRFSFKGSYLGFIALKSIQIRFATVLPILMESRSRERESQGATTGDERPQDGSRGPHIWRHAAFTCTAEWLKFLLQVISLSRHKYLQILTNSFKNNFYLFDYGM